MRFERGVHAPKIAESETDSKSELRCQVCGKFIELVPSETEKARPDVRRLNLVEYDVRHARLN